MSAPQEGVGGCVPSPRKLSPASGQDGGGDAEGGLHQDRAQEVGEQVADDDPRGASPEGPRGGDVILAFQRQHLDPDEPCVPHPTHDAEGQNHVLTPGPKIAIRAKARRIPGNARKTSVSRMSDSSTRPPM